MGRIDLDLSRLFGFKIVAAELARQEQQGSTLELGAKLGQKQGEKAPPPNAAPRIGAKIGDKGPPVAIAAKIGEKNG